MVGCRTPLLMILTMLVSSVHGSVGDMCSATQICPATMAAADGETCEAVCCAVPKPTEAPSASPSASPTTTPTTVPPAWRTRWN